MRSVLHFIIATTLITTLYGVELTTEQELKLLNYKRKISPSNRVKYQRLMRYMAKVDRSSAIEKTKKISNEDIKEIRLKHKNRKLFYYVKTKSYAIKIDAIDGEIIEKRRLD